MNEKNVQCEKRGESIVQLREWAEVSEKLLFILDGLGRHFSPLFISTAPSIVSNLKISIIHRYNLFPYITLYRLPSRFCGINIITDKFGNCFLKTSDMSHSNPIYTHCFLLFFCFVKI